MIALIRCLEEENKNLVQEIPRFNIVVSNSYEALEDLCRGSENEFTRVEKKEEKPGTGLLGGVEGSQPPPPGSCSVLIAGANDIGASRSSTSNWKTRSPCAPVKLGINSALSPQPLPLPPY
ncbi:hypothetical protein J6590_084430 [Homalodisca vitripennis]|nr:hypothetical protein J6590_084430 [Homalodisca vitripennis]